MKEKQRKIVFWGAVFLSYVSIWLLNYFTPYLSDDLVFRKEVGTAHSLADLINQQYIQYMTQNGRAVVHMFVRLSFCSSKAVFNIINSGVFVILTLLMYYNVEKKKKYDFVAYIILTTLVWIFGVSFGQTVLWETGACNYLWGTTLILGFVSLVKYCNEKKMVKKYQQITAIVLIVVMGILAGWCNENTSGGGMLLLFLSIIYFWYEKRKLNKPAIIGSVSMVTGFLFMILAPGYQVRAAYMGEEYSGLLKYMSRFYKCTLEIKENFFLLIVLFCICLIVARMQKVSWEDLRNALTFFGVGIVTCYAIVLSPTPMPRVYFGAGIFLMIACVQCIYNVMDMNIYIPAIKMSLASVLLLFMVFEFIGEGMNVARINREYTERENYILQQKSEGVEDITVPMLRPQFETKYSFGYDSDIDESPKYWMNVVFAQYYDVNSITGITREEWTEY